MFSKGDYVVYSNNGVCVVDDITTLQMGGASSDDLYYKLIPLDKNGGRIMTPVDNNKSVMRKIMSRSEAEELIKSVDKLEPVEVPNDKVREEIYKKAMLSCNPSQWLQVILTINNRKQERKASGRRITSVDERYFRQVENELFGELSFVLGRSKEDIRDKVNDMLNQRL